MYNFGNGLVTGVIILCIACVVIFWGGWELIDWLFIDDAIKVSKPIIPEVELIINENQVDTLYVYRK